MVVPNKIKAYGKPPDNTRYSISNDKISRYVIYHFMSLMTSQHIGSNVDCISFTWRSHCINVKSHCDFLQFTSEKTTSHYGTSHHVTSQHVTPFHVTPRHITSHHISSCHVSAHHTTSRHTTSHYVTPRHTTSHHVTLRHTTSRHTTSQRSTSHCTTSHQWLYNLIQHQW